MTRSQVDGAVEAVKVRLDKITDVCILRDFVDISGTRGGDPVIFRVRPEGNEYRITVR